MKYTMEGEVSTLINLYNELQCNLKIKTQRWLAFYKPPLLKVPGSVDWSADFLGLNLWIGLYLVLIWGYPPYFDPPDKNRGPAFPRRRRRGRGGTGG